MPKIIMFCQHFSTNHKSYHCGIIVASPLDLPNGLICTDPFIKSQITFRQSNQSFIDISLYLEQAFPLLLGSQYGTMEKAWHAFMNAADKLSEIHMDLKEKLVMEDSEKIRVWQKDAYHKQMIGGFKETKDADEGFRKAQKPWVRKLKEVSYNLMYSQVIYTNTLRSEGADDCVFLIFL